jgi:hypothetical protein
VIKECERHLDKEAAQKKLDALPTVTRRKEPPLTADPIRETTDRLGDIAQRIQAADADKKEPLYEALGITITYDNATRTATVGSRPSLPDRYEQCPRGESTADDTVVVAQGLLAVQDRQWCSTISS